jgi:hypothetical protein
MNSVLTRKLEAAVLLLAGHGAIKDRFCAAFSDQLEDIEAEELPEDTQREFTDMVNAVHRARVLPGDSLVRASVRKLSNDEVQRYSALVVRIYTMQVQHQTASAAAPAFKSPPRIAAADREATPLAALLNIDRSSAATRAKSARGP